MKQDVRKFTQTCIYWIISREVDKSPRPSASAFHGEKQNEITHDDFLEMCAADKYDLKYLLQIKDDLSSNEQFYPCESVERDEETIEYRSRRHDLVLWDD